MQGLQYWMVLLMTFLTATTQAEDCAVNFSELDKTEKLKTIKPLIPSKARKGFVNETEGSYFFITEGDPGFHILFFTTGLFDLYGVRREGPLKFCDNNGELTVVGLDRIQRLKADGDKLIFDEGLSRQIFREGPMPEYLKRKNSFDPMQLDPKPK